MGDGGGKALCLSVSRKVQLGIAAYAAFQDCVYCAVLRAPLCVLVRRQ